MPTDQEWAMHLQRSLPPLEWGSRRPGQVNYTEVIITTRYLYVNPRQIQLLAQRLVGVASRCCTEPDVRLEL